MKKHIINTIAGITALFAVNGCVNAQTAAVGNGVQQPVTISIRRDGALSVAGTKCRENELNNRISSLSAKQKVGVVVQAESGAPFKKVAAVLNACEAAGVKQVSLASNK